MIGGYIDKTINYINEKLSLKTLSAFTSCLIFISLILFDTYVYVFDPLRGVFTLTKSYNNN